MRRAQQSQEEDVEFAAAWYACTMDKEKPTLNTAVKTKDILTAVGMTAVLPAPKKGEAITVIALGRYLERQVDKIRTLDGGTIVAIRRAAEDTHTKTQRWKLDVLEARPEARKQEDVVPF